MKVRIFRQIYKTDFISTCYELHQRASATVFLLFIYLTEAAIQAPSTRLGKVDKVDLSQSNQ